MRAPASATVPASGDELAVDAVEARRLAGAVGPDQRDELAGGRPRTRRRRPRRTPPKALRRCHRPSSTGALIGIALRRARAQRAADAHREREHDERG